MKFDEIKQQDSTVLNKQLLDMKKEQLNLRFQQANGLLTNTSRIREVRRIIAKIRTAMHARAESASK